MKGDIHRNFALSIKNNIKDYGNYVFGMHVSDFGKSNKFKYGIQVELNLWLIADITTLAINII